MTKKLKTPSKANRSFLSNLKIKIYCFLLAIAVYFLIGFFQTQNKTYTVNLKIENLKDYLVISNPLPETVKIVVRDKISVFDKISNEEFNARLDLSKIENSLKTKIRISYDIPKSMQSFFSHISLIPEEIEVDVEKLVEKNVNVNPSVVGEPAADYRLVKVITNPAVIRIQGPQSILAKIKSLNTENINISGVTESFTRSAQLVTGNANVKPLGKVDVVVLVSSIKSNAPRE